MNTVYIVNQDQMGHGDVDLGRKILRTCLRKLINQEDVETVVFYNGGVRLLTKDSHAAVEIGLLLEKGIELLPCRTCVDHFDIKADLVTDRLSDMDEILAILHHAEKVVTL
jgi:intracellular sulfur oxidation DsrE/DsrF family protein